MTRTLSLALLLAALSAGPAFAQKTCTKVDQQEAMKAIDRVSSWLTLQSTWKTYRHCDSGEIGGAFTEALLRLIIDWKNIEQLANQMKEPEYEDFIVKHLTSPEAKNDAEDVYSRAKKKCPSTLTAWCTKIASTVDEQPLKPIAPAAPPAPAPDKK